MNDHLYLDPGTNVKRRALIRSLLLVIIVIAAISILYGVWGSTLTPAIPADLTAVRLSGPAFADTVWQYTVADPKEVADFARVISDIGPLPKARPHEIDFARTIFITLVDGAGGELTYTFNTGGFLQAEGSQEYEFLNYQALKSLIWDTVPDDTPNWLPIQE